MPETPAADLLPPSPAASPPEESVGIAPPTGGPAHAAYLATRTFGSLDGLRFFCALAVIWHHAPGFVGGPILFERGYLGVDMFFVLSGFLIVTLLLRERDRRGAIRLGDFYVRRTLRIFPIYYGLIAAVALGYALKGWSGAGARQFGDALPYLLTYTLNWVRVPAGNFFIAWTLAAEEQFYLVWPAIEKFLSRAATWATLAVGLVVNQMVNFGLLDGVFERIYGAPRPLYITHITFTPILLGVALAHLLHHPRGYRLLAPLVGRRWSPVALGLGLLVLLQAAPEDVVGWPRLAMQLAMALLLASLVVREDHHARPLLAIPLLAHFGAISYGTYLYHQWGIHGARLLLGRAGIGGHWPLFLLTTAVTLGMAEASYRLVEHPLSRLKARFRR